MTCTHCQPLLSAYIDDSLSGHDRAGVEAHVHKCAVCRSFAEDLRRIRAAARSLEPMIPQARVWQQIAVATQSPPSAGWFAGWLAWRPLAAVAMTALIATSLWRVGTLLGPTDGQGSRVAMTRPAAVVVDLEADFTDAIARLEQVTNADRDVLDQDTAMALDDGLMVIDRAINESRAALQVEPQSESARESLYAALRRKVALLQESIALTNEIRRVNQ